MQMLRVLCYRALLLSCLFSGTLSIDVDFPHCSCDDNSFWNVELILYCQKVSDFLIAVAYFSIPLEILYFLTCSNIFPFKWIILQFGAFIVLCGLTHLLNVFSYEPHSFLLMLSLTISKFLCALVSFATAITLLTLIPQLLRLKVRENLLRIKTHELDREVELRKRQEAASWHVRMLTQEIRKSLDKHTILYTTLVELSKTLDLQNCAVWMPCKDKAEMNLTHELRQRSSSSVHDVSIPINDPDITEITEKEGVRMLGSDSLLARRSSGSGIQPGAVAAIRMPMLKVSNFKGGTPQMIQTCYAILVLVLPSDNFRTWSHQELEIVEVVADQVAVALSHAAVLEESQLMRDELFQQNRVLQQAQMNAVMASEVRNSFQSVMSQGMRRPMHSITGLLSVLQQETLSPIQKLVTDVLEKTSSVIVKLVDDITETPDVGNESLALEMRHFQLHSMVRTAAIVAKSLCLYRGFDFDLQVASELPDHVIGDEKRIIQVLMHMIANLLNGENGVITFDVRKESRTHDKPDERWFPWKISSPDGNVNVKFEIGIKRSPNKRINSSMLLSRISKTENDGVGMTLGYNMCKKLVQMMQGNIWAVRGTEGAVECMTLLLGFQLFSSRGELDQGGSLDSYRLGSNTHLNSTKVLLADSDLTNRVVTQKMLEKLGCFVSSVSSGLDCLVEFHGPASPFSVVILDINIPGMDGFEVASKIREFRRTSGPMIVALTSNAVEDVWEKCMQSGMVGVIQKPVVLSVFADELRRIMRKP